MTFVRTVAALGLAVIVWVAADWLAERLEVLALFELPLHVALVLVALSLSEPWLARHSA